MCAGCIIKNWAIRGQQDRRNPPAVHLEKFCRFLSSGFCSEAQSMAGRSSEAAWPLLKGPRASSLQSLGRPLGWNGPGLFLHSAANKPPLFSPANLLFYRSVCIWWAFSSPSVSLSLTGSCCFWAVSATNWPVWTSQTADLHAPGVHTSVCESHILQAWEPQREKLFALLITQLQIHSRSEFSSPLMRSCSLWP